MKLQGPVYPIMQLYRLLRFSKGLKTQLLCSFITYFTSTTTLVLAWLKKVFALGRPIQRRCWDLIGIHFYRMIGLNDQKDRMVKHAPLNISPMREL